MEVATTWYFAFRDGHKPICRFLRRGFGHVCAWTMLDGRAILINPTTSVVEVRSSHPLVVFLLFLSRFNCRVHTFARKHAAGG